MQTTLQIRLAIKCESSARIITETNISKYLKMSVLLFWVINQILSTLQTNTDTLADCEDPDETGRNKPYHQDFLCLTLYVDFL